jgi:hypothetical protein
MPRGAGGGVVGGVGVAGAGVVAGATGTGGQTWSQEFPLYGGTACHAISGIPLALYCQYRRAQKHLNSLKRNKDMRIIEEQDYGTEQT